MDKLPAKTTDDGAVHIDLPARLELGVKGGTMTVVFFWDNEGKVWYEAESTWEGKKEGRLVRNKRVSGLSRVFFEDSSLLEV